MCRKNISDMIMLRNVNVMQNIFCTSGKTVNFYNFLVPNQTICDIYAGQYEMQQHSLRSLILRLMIIIRLACKNKRHEKSVQTAQAAAFLLVLSARNAAAAVIPVSAPAPPRPPAASLSCSTNSSSSDSSSSNSSLQETHRHTITVRGYDVLPKIQTAHERHTGNKHNSFKGSIEFPFWCM